MGSWIKDPESPATDSQKLRIRKAVERIGKPISWFRAKTGKMVADLTKGEAHRYIVALEKMEMKKTDERADDNQA